MDVIDKNKTDQSINIASLLIEARENLDLTSNDIADTLNLANEVIDKIESNDFDQGIPRAFIRGYVKSYATKVGLDTIPILHEFDQQSGMTSPSLKRVESIASFKKKPQEINSGHYLFKMISILIVIAFLSFAGWELWTRLTNQSPVLDDVQYSYGTLESLSIQLDTNRSVNRSGISDDDLGDQVELNTTSNTKLSGNSNAKYSIQAQTDQNKNAVGKTENTTSDLDSTNPSNLIDTSNIIMTDLILDFSADCWVKIVDARGEILAEGVKINGKHMPLKGAPPISVILGDPSAVTLNYAGSTYDLSEYRAGRRVEILLN